MSGSLLKNVSVIMLSHNRKDEIQKNIPRICEAITGSGAEFIVVDSASTDGSQNFLSTLETKHDNLTAILTNKDLGVAEGRNAGCREAEGDFLLIIDDDTRITLKNIEDLVQTANDCASAGIITPKIDHFKTGQPQNDHGNKLQEVGNYHGACHLIKREVWNIVGEFDPKCTFGGEELDYSIRSRNAGYTVLYQPSTTVKHNNRSMSKGISNHRRKKWTYNYLRIHAKHFPLSIALLFSFRYLIAQCFSAASSRQLSLVFGCCFAGLQGWIEGRRNHYRISEEVIQYYNNHSVRPDMGNIPLFMKIKRYL